MTPVPVGTQRQVNRLLVPDGVSEDQGVIGFDDLAAFKLEVEMAVRSCAASQDDDSTGLLIQRWTIHDRPKSGSSRDLRCGMARLYPSGKVGNPGGLFTTRMASSTGRTQSCGGMDIPVDHFGDRADLRIALWIFFLPAPGICEIGRASCRERV